MRYTGDLKRSQSSGIRKVISVLLTVFLLTVPLLPSSVRFGAAAEEIRQDTIQSGYYVRDYDQLERTAKSVFLVNIYASDYTDLGIGSGFLLFDEKLFVTNQHVIDGSSYLTVMDEYGEQYLLDQVVISDKEHDIAMLLFPEGKNYNSLEYDASFDTLKRMQPVVAIGSPLGYWGTTTPGNISGFPWPRGKDISLIQITVPVSPGSSGGCLLNENLEVIGVTSEGRQDGQNLNFAIPVFIVEKLYQEWNKKDTVTLGTEESWDTVGHGLHGRISGTAPKQQAAVSQETVISYEEDDREEYDFAEAAERYRKAAEQGDASAQVNLGNCYYSGDGVPQDYAEAVKWYRKAAEQGYAEAQYNLGVCYDFGTGTEQDEAEAVKWYRKAAEQEYANAQNNLGNCYYSGLGVQQNYTEAVKWYRKAAAQGNAIGQNNLGNCYKYGEGVRQNYEEAVKWYRKAAEQGCSYAQYNLANMYHFGKGVAQDYTETVKWLKKSAEQGYPYAQYNLGYCYYHGEGIAQDYAEAFKWYRKAADQGHAVAQYNLAYSYFYGEGIACDFIEAVQWFRKAAEQGYADAMYYLGVCYEKGLGVVQDDAEAEAWYRKAKEQRR